MPTKPIADIPSPQERGELDPLSGETLMLALSKAAVEGRFHVIGEAGQECRVRITDAPEEAQKLIDAGDFRGLMRYIQESKVGNNPTLKPKRSRK